MSEILNKFYNAFNSESVDYSQVENMDTFNKIQVTGSTVRINTENLYGFNHRKVYTVPDSNYLNSGYAFFTRPLIKLTNGNIRNNKELYDLLDKNELSIYRYVRCILDPRLIYENKLNTVLVDNEQGFIPLLTNSLKTLSGWPDLVTPTFTSQEGVRKEQYLQVDGTYEVNNQNDINCTFRNSLGEPVINLIKYWTMCQSLLFEGMMDSYKDLMINNEIPYTTRVYRLVMDNTLTKVVSISATGYSFPVNVPIGQMFDYTSDRPYIDANKELSIKFASVGVIIDEAECIRSFNEVTAVCNPSYANMLDGLPHDLVKIPKDLLNSFQHRGYPFINIETRELEWYVHSNTIG